MKRIFQLSGSILIIGVIVLIIFNYRYPFFTSEVGNWSVGFGKMAQVFPKSELDLKNVITYEYINSIIPGPIDYIADPFFIKESDTYYLFVELKGEGNANIALLTSLNGQDYEYKGIVLDEPFHLSYPQVFKHKEEFYMLPEASGSNHLLLYKAENFPYNWKISDTLMKNRRFKDPSLLLSDEIKLIVAIDDDYKQYVLSSDSLRGSWSVIQNNEQWLENETRPGGRFFQIDNDWFLPFQNHSLGYGTGISLYKLHIQNDCLEFRIADKLYLGPQKEIAWFNRGMHHLDIQELDEGYYMVYDGDRNLKDNSVFQYKRTIKFNLMDIYNYLLEH